jgi:hypothetical protein
MNHGRKPEFQRNTNLEELLTEINSLLKNVEEKAVKKFRKPQFPVLLVLGGPRSGSTLMMQWIASLGTFSYPTNLLSRFYEAPYIGAKIQLLLTHPDYNFKNEILDFNSNCSFSSNLGKTEGALEPNDFWYFWRRFIPNKLPRYLNKSEEQTVRKKNLLAEIAAIEHVFKKPFAMKGMILEQNIPFLASIFEKIVFLNLRRHPFFNIQSLLESRLKFFGDITKWYSIRPKQYNELIKLDPIKQVAGQVYYKNMAVKVGLSKIDRTKYLNVDYEKFCENPQLFFNKIREKYQEQGEMVKWEYNGPERYNSANKVRLNSHDVKQVIEAYREFSGECIHP